MHHTERIGGVKVVHLGGLVLQAHGLRGKLVVLRQRYYVLNVQIDNDVE